MCRNANSLWTGIRRCLLQPAQHPCFLPGEGMVWTSPSESFNHAKGASDVVWGVGRVGCVLSVRNCSLVFSFCCDSLSPYSMKTLPYNMRLSRQWTSMCGCSKKSNVLSCAPIESSGWPVSSISNDKALVLNILVSWFQLASGSSHFLGLPAYWTMPWLKPWFQCALWRWSCLQSFRQIIHVSQHPNIYFFPSNLICFWGQKQFYIILSCIQY